MELPQDPGSSPSPIPTQSGAAVVPRPRRRHEPRRFLPLEGRKKFALAALAMTAVMAIACAWAILELRQFLSSIPAEGYDPADGAAVARAEDVGGRVDSFASIALAARVLCAVAFLMWFYRAHENLRLGGLPHVERSSGWAVGSFFVPIAGMFVPCVAMTDVWKGSSALAGEGTRAEWKRGTASPLVLGWWIAFLGASMFAVVANVMTGRDARGQHAEANVGQLISATTWMLASRLVEIVAAGAAIALVVRITSLQARSQDGHLATVFE